MIQLIRPLLFLSLTAEATARIDVFNSRRHHPMLPGEVALIDARQHGQQHELIQVDRRTARLAREQGGRADGDMPPAHQ